MLYFHLHQTLLTFLDKFWDFLSLQHQDGARRSTATNLPLELVQRQALPVSIYWSVISIHPSIHPEQRSLTTPTDWLIYKG